MKWFLQHTRVFLALSLYVIGGALIESTHHDHVNVLLRSRPVLESHDCGAVELHLSIEEARRCAACSHFAQRLSTQAPPVVLAAAGRDALVIATAGSEELLSTDIHHSGKRGPPHV